MRYNFLINYEDFYLSFIILQFSLNSKILFLYFNFLIFILLPLLLEFVIKFVLLLNFTFLVFFHIIVLRQFNLYFLINLFNLTYLFKLFDHHQLFLYNFLILSIYFDFFFVNFHEILIDFLNHHELFYIYCYYHLIY